MMVDHPNKNNARLTGSPFSPCLYGRLLFFFLFFSLLFAKSVEVFSFFFRLIFFRYGTSGLFSSEFADFGVKRANVYNFERQTKPVRMMGPCQCRINPTQFVIFSFFLPHFSTNVFHIEITQARKKRQTYFVINII